MEKRKKVRSAKRTAFTRALNVFVDKCNSNAPHKDIEVAFQMVEEKMDELAIISNECLDALYEADNIAEEDIQKEIEDTDDYRRKFLEARTSMQELTKEHSKTIAPNDSDSTSGITVVSARTGETKKSFKLPKIELVKFSGSVREWLQFWSVFKKIHVDNSICKEDKFQYLLQAMVPGSRAAELVRSYPPTDENYGKVIDSLKNRFGRDDLQIEVYVRDLLQLVLNNGLRSAIPLSSLYDKIESYLRALASLGVTADKYAAMLFPLVESCLPEELLRAWQRYCCVSSARTSERGTSPTEAKDRLSLLIGFLEDEVQNELRISMATEKFGFLANKEIQKPKKSNVQSAPNNVPSAANLLATNKRVCVFCASNHESVDCEKAETMDWLEKKECAKKGGACCKCLKAGHIAKTCHVKKKCEKCGYRHATVMCRAEEFSASKSANDQPKVKVINETNCASLSRYPTVFLQTLRVKLQCNGKELEVRALIDTGSQHSYILSEIAKKMGYKPIDSLMMNHLLFGGSRNNLVSHHRYEVKLSDLDNTSNYSFIALDQAVICESVPKVRKGTWCDELSALNISLSDISSDSDNIALLIGSDIAGKLKTGHVRQLACGMTAEETRLGWVLSGKVPGHHEVGDAVTTISMFVRDCNVENLWSLDAIGIKDPIMLKTQVEQEELVKTEFLRSVTINDEGRYEVPLPWTENHPPLDSNKGIALRRLQSTAKKLTSDGYYADYDDVFQNWINLGIIERVPKEEEQNWGHYMPHRHVIKENSTTVVRPVFDASSKLPPHPSINDCLHKGSNLIESIANILLRFREGKIGVISDVEKAFLQISICPKDRDFLRFFWFDKDGNIIILRHCRVVFGVTSSPFILGAIIEHHLNNILKRSDITPAMRANILKLIESLYVDNSVTSFNTEIELYNFIKDAKNVMELAKFNLRGWEFTNDNSQASSTNVLGLIWDKIEDSLYINSVNLKDFDLNSITKRSILSAAHRVFDPLGFLSAVTLYPRILLQETQLLGVSWDEPLDENIRSKFIKWFDQLKNLSKIRIPRCFLGSLDGIDELSLHTFVDASKFAYAAVIFLRVQRGNDVRVNFMQAKSRVAPMKDGKTHHSIPRLELLAAIIGVRLAANVLKNLKIKNLNVYYWSDSSTVLAWIYRQNNWGTFVWNRIKEIRAFSHPQQWRHVPGSLNPADLPSRGCSIEQIISSKWCEGPLWLKGKSDEWPQPIHVYNEEEIQREIRKTPLKVDPQSRSVVSLFASNRDSEVISFHKYSSYYKIWRIFAWIFRFFNNTRRRGNVKISYLTVEELKAAEIRLLKLVQSQAFTGLNDKNIRHLDPIVDDSGLIRLKSRITLRDDEYDFIFPIILPRNNHLVRLIIIRLHEDFNHAGVEISLTHVRQKFWVLGGRKEIRSVIGKCVICRRYDAKPLSVTSAPLPLNRVRDATVFEVIGIDFAGPIVLKGNTKAWICIFTCAIYRAVHLELVSSLSTSFFFMSLRRFIARRGRPAVIYSDQGKNFEGAVNKLNKIDFKRVASDSAMLQIEWKMNPPSSPWWGGFWERLIGVLKRLLRRTLHKACLEYEEMLTVLLDCEAIINSRPISFQSDSSNEVTPLTPSHFLQDIREIGTVDLDEIDSSKLTKREAYRMQIKKCLRKRFRNEYLGALIKYKNDCEKLSNFIDKPKINDIVFVGSDNCKRLDWPLAKIKDIMYSHDKNIRVVRLSTANGELIRPTQRLYPLELRYKCNQEQKGQGNGEVPKSENLSVNKRKNDDMAIQSDKGKNVVTTRSGRVSKMPQRLMY